MAQLLQHVGDHHPDYDLILDQKHPRLMGTLAAALRLDIWQTTKSIRVFATSCSCPIMMPDAKARALRFSGGALSAASVAISRCAMKSFNAPRASCNFFR